MAFHPSSSIAATLTGLTALTLGGLLASCVHPAVTQDTFTTPATTERVGRRGANRTVTSVNQVLTPLGRTVELPGLRPQALALSPHGRILVTSGKTSEIVVVDPATGNVRQRVALPSEKQGEPPPAVVSPHILEPDPEGQVSSTGLVFAPDGRRLVLSNVNGSLKVFAVAPDGTVTPSHSVPLPLANAPRRKEDIPSGLTFSLDGARLYVCGNLSNQLFELDATTGKVRRTFPVGVAPYAVVLVGTKAYVSNWGGRRPDSGDLTGPAGRGTVVRVDAEKHIASEGSVTVIPLATTTAAASKLHVFTTSTLFIPIAPWAGNAQRKRYPARCRP